MKRKEKVFLLKNKRNKCMSSESANPHGGGPNLPYETNCDPNDRYQHWKWCGNNNLCNHFGKFLSKKFGGTTNDENGNTKKRFFIKLMDLATSEYFDQKWRATEVGQLVDSSGLCLGVEYKSDDSENLRMSVDSCTKKDDGQFWSFASSLVDDSTSTSQFLESPNSNTPSKLFNVTILFL